ncbi:hypothetical protein Hdeb2414_s0001g00037581 [Helianthus debilis subsp. tardiflorus]
MQERKRSRRCCWRCTTTVAMSPTGATGRRRPCWLISTGHRFTFVFWVFVRVSHGLDLGRRWFEFGCYGSDSALVQLVVQRVQDSGVSIELRVLFVSFRLMCGHRFRSVLISGRSTGQQVRVGQRLRFRSSGFESDSASISIDLSK